MKIVKLTAENVKRLRAVEIEPDGNLVVISGRNAQGKSSVLDSIWMALAGSSGSKETTRPVRDGESHAEVTLDLGEFTVTRRWSGERTTLSVMSKDGMKPSSPQKFLDERLGALSFDPLAFAQSDTKTQLATLLGLVHLPFDPDELAQRRRNIYEQRTEIGRALKETEGQLASLGDVPQGTPDEEVPLATILAQKDEYEHKNRELSEINQNLVEAQNQVRLAQENLARAQVAAYEADENLEDAQARARSAQVLPEIDFGKLMGQLEATNAHVRLRREREKVGTRVGQLKIEQRNLTGELERIDRDKADALAKAKMPIDGLGFDDDGVTYNDVPLKQSSGAEQLRVSVAMAMALNPEIRVIRVSDGSLLDSDNMALISQMAQDSDFQIWVERVDESGSVGFVIEDGEIAGDF